MKNTIWTIEELYKWACENGVQNYTCFAEEEGCPRNLCKSEITIDKEKEEVLL